MSNRFDRHCGSCGWLGEFDSVPNRGSDVVPISRCPWCDTVTATKCGCSDPGRHDE